MKVNEIFYSLQGEGYWIGTPAVFVRFSGCNLKCRFCDTAHQDYSDMEREEIVAAVCRYPARHVVLTGGEPTLQIDALLLQMLKNEGKYVQIETNGTVMLDNGVVDLIDWVTCSPKNDGILIQRIDEVKVVYQGDSDRIKAVESLVAKHNAKAMLQPCDVGDAEKNREIVASAIEYVKKHPMWRLSVQTHKMLDIR